MVGKFRKILEKHFKSTNAKTLDILFAVSVASLVAYIGIWSYINDIIPKRPIPPNPQTILIHQAPRTNVIEDVGISLFKNSTNQLDTFKYLTDKNPETFNIGDVVRVKYFDITGVVLEKTEFPWDQTFSIMYKDVQHQLHVIVLPKEFLSRPPAGLIHFYDLDLGN